MPRPTRGRRICVRPAYERFTPAGFPGGEAVTLLVEEYECVRSIDHDGLKQEECAKRMAISRTTVAEIYAAARKKIAESLVHGRPLVIEGGFYQLCDMSAPCGKCCPRAEARQDYRFSPPRKKGEGTMRIAVPYENENGTVFQHFGHSQAFKLYDVKEDAVEKSEVVSTQGSGHGALAGFLKENEVDALICGGIGAGAIEALTDAGIRVYAGVKRTRLSHSISPVRLSIRRKQTARIMARDMSTPKAAIAAPTRTARAKVSTATAKVTEKATVVSPTAKGTAKDMRSTTAKAKRTHTATDRTPPQSKAAVRIAAKAAATATVAVATEQATAHISSNRRYGLPFSIR